VGVDAQLLLVSSTKFERFSLVVCLGSFMVYGFDDFLK